jgi:hypothetical protein
VINQPTLTGFPRTVFASAKRRLQASVRLARLRVLRHSLCGYALLFSRFLPAAWLEAIDPTARQRHFGHIPVFWAWLAQILEANASCTKALGLIQAWSRSAGLPVPTGGSGGYCTARLRIDEDFLQAISGRITACLDQAVRPSDLWHGHVVKVIDGSRVLLMDTPPNQAAYPQPCTQKPGCGFPMMGIVGMLNLSHGGWVGFETCDQRDHDSAIAPRLLKHVDAGDVVLADRAFCSYEYFARLLDQGAHGVMRLHQMRHAALDWRRGKKLGRDERLYIWKKPQQPDGSGLSAKQWAALPEQLVVRYIKRPYVDRTGRKRMLVIATTLLDPVEYPAADLCDLYAQRWEIELKLRDIKSTLGMEDLAVRTPAMAHKTLWMTMIAYNLMRCVMQQAAVEAGKPLVEISFKGILDHATASQDSYLMHRGKPRCLAWHHRSVMETCATKLVDIRSGRREPRALKRRARKYPPLTAPRGIYREKPNKGKTKRAA